MKILSFFLLFENFSTTEKIENNNDPAILDLKVTKRIIGGDQSSGYPWLAALWGAAEGQFS